MWVIFTIITIILIYFYLNNKGKEIQQVIREGGMLKKYNYIVQTILSGDKKAKVTHQSGDTIHINLITSGGVTRFTLKHNNGKLTVKWKTINNPIFGDHNLQWTFSAEYDQEKIMAIIINELGIYQEKLLANRYKI